MNQNRLSLSADLREAIEDYADAKEESEQNQGREGFVAAIAPSSSSAMDVDKGSKGKGKSKKGAKTP